ncbi:hypothetical protein [Planococcus beigongshangi]|uniref:hypothetical protein n=1 Tax=Planococcus beigongshangi TaxID=2782536 RepID=UPI00193BDA86|nr:hypothetical protein [Planococcus beigongshangi]
MKPMSLIGGIDEYQLNKRFKSEESPAGRLVYFLAHNGYPSELEHAMSIIPVNKVLTVKEIYVGRSSSTVEFKEYPGKRFNTVMFADINFTERRKIRRFRFNLKSHCQYFLLTCSMKPERMENN